MYIIMYIPIGLFFLLLKIHNRSDDLIHFLAGASLPFKNIIMIIIGGILIYLAIKKEYEPMLLLPIGFGAILSNIPGSSATGEHGILTVLYEAGIANELFPALIFISIGAMIDFTPLLQNPIMFFYGAAVCPGCT